MSRDGTPVSVLINTLGGVRTVRCSSWPLWVMGRLRGGAGPKSPARN